MSRSEPRARAIPTVAALALLLAAAAAAPAARASESYDACVGFIDALPATVTKQGVWCLRKDLSTAVASGVAIQVATNNVTIDCNGFKLGGLAAGTGTATTGIQSTGRTATAVRNCNIRGFAIGVMLSGGSRHLVEANRFDGNTLWGVFVSGTGSTIRRNLVLDTGGGSYSPGTTRTAIGASGGAEVIDNTVSGMTPASTVDTGVVGIYLADGVATGNRVGGLLSPFRSEGFFVQATAGAILEDNFVGGFGHVAFYCTGAVPVARDNTINGFTTAFTNCIDGGGNVHRP
jgi:hypothetical protein